MTTPPSAPSLVACRDIPDDAQFSVGRYIDDFCNHFDSSQFGALHLPVDAQTAHDKRHGRERHTAVGAWKKCGDIGAVALCQN